MENTVSRFNRLWVPVPESGCWLWTGAVYGSKKFLYGKFGIKNESGKWTLVAAHRYSWYIAHGSIPEGQFVCHTCDVPLCVNPAHLFLGSHGDNMADMHMKGRGVNPKPCPMPGILHPNAKLNEAQVVAIRADCRKPSVIAASYGIAYRTVAAIKKRERWAHII